MTNPIKIISEKNYLDKNKKPNQEEIWDSIANPWKEYRVEVIPIVKEFLKNKQGKVIDLGCGSGRNMIKLPNIEYYGVDFSGVQLKHAKKHIHDEKINAQIFKSEVSQLDKKIFSDNMFDYGLFIATLHCLETSKERLDSLKEFYRVLKNNSEALITVWNSEDKRFNCVNNSGGVYMSWSEDNVNYMRYYYLYSREEFKKLVENVGFKILEFYEPRDRDRFSRMNFIIRVKKV